MLVLIDSRRVSGTYSLVYTASHYASDYSVGSVSITVTVQNNCNDGTVNLNDISSGQVIPFSASASFDFKTMTASMLSEPKCLPMTANATFKFRLAALLYGTSNIVVVDSVTNTSKYNQLFTSINGSDATNLNPSLNFVTDLKLTYKVTGSYDTVDTTLASWVSAQKTLVFNVFKIVPSATQTLEFTSNASPAQSLSILSTSVFSTNMDGNASFPAY